MKHTILLNIQGNVEVDEQGEPNWKTVEYQLEDGEEKAYWCLIDLEEFETWEEAKKHREDRGKE